MNIGAGWKKKTKEGKDFLSLVIDVPFLGSISLLLFKNEHKKAENHPDYNVIWNPRQKQNSDYPQDSIF